MTPRLGSDMLPFSETENIVKGVSDYIDGDLRKKYPMIGRDVKVMGLRQKDDRITLTIGCAMVDRYCAGLSGYIEMKDILNEAVLKRCEDLHHSFN